MMTSYQLNSWRQSSLNLNKNTNIRFPESDSENACIISYLLFIPQSFNIQLFTYPIPQNHCQSSHINLFCFDSSNPFDLCPEPDNCH